MKHLQNAQPKITHTIHVNEKVENTIDLDTGGGDLLQCFAGSKTGCVYVSFIKITIMK
jgi:hypothetical protein